MHEDEYTMAPSTPGLAFIDRSHTGGRDLASDIVLSVALGGAIPLMITDEDEPGAFGFTEVDDGYSTFWVWRKK